MAVNQGGEKIVWWRRYFIIGIGILLTGLVVVALVYSWDKIQDAAGYGYAGAFVVSIMAGVTIIPAPALPVVFTLGNRLDPLYIGLVAGLGEALGGVTVYLTGAGGGTIWSKLRAKQPAVYNQAGTDGVPLVPRGSRRSGRDRPTLRWRSPDHCWTRRHHQRHLPPLQEGA